MTETLKALTHINIPFIDERYAPGDMIPRSAFEEAYGKHAPRLLRPDPNDENASPVPTADEVIADLIEWGSLSEDPDAPIHPDHVIPDPNRLSMVSLVAQAQVLVAEIEEAGGEVPAKLRSLADISDKQIGAAEEALSDERVA